MTGEDDEDEVYGLTVAELSPDIVAALDRNQRLSPTNHCSRPLAFLPLKPIDITPIYRRMNFVSKKDEDAVPATVQQWLSVKVIEPAPEDCLNCFPILAVPKADSDVCKTGTRSCLNVRLLNARLPADDYELPRIQDVIDQTASCTGDDVY